MKKERIMHVEKLIYGVSILIFVWNYFFLVFFSLSGMVVGLKFNGDD